MADPPAEEAKGPEGRKSDMESIVSAMRHITFSFPEADLRDLVGLDSHACRAVLVKLLCEAGGLKEELTHTIL